MQIMPKTKGQWKSKDCENAVVERDVKRVVYLINTAGVKS